MRNLRGLYVALVYILTAPFMMIGMMLMALLNIKHPINTLKAVAWGLKIGHKSNMVWVKTGQKC